MGRIDIFRFWDFIHSLGYTGVAASQLQQRLYIFIIFGYNSISVGPRSNAKPHAKYAEMGLVNEQTTANTYTPLTLPGRLDKVEYVHLHKPI